MAWSMPVARLPRAHCAGLGAEGDMDPNLGANSDANGADSCSLSELTINDLEQLGVSEPMSANDFLQQFKWALPGSRRQPASEEDKPVILSVDDDAVNHLVIRTHLGKSYRIVEAMNGYEALDYLRSDGERPVVVLLDIMMPGMTGLQVVQQIRQTLKLSHTVLPVVILSAQAPLDETTRASLNHGATDFMPKPFSGQALHAKVGIYPQVRRDCLTLYQKALQYRRRAHEKIGGTGEVIWTTGRGEGQERDGGLAAAREEILRLRDELAIAGELEEEASAELRRELASAEEGASRLRDEVDSLWAQAEDSREEAEGLREENRRLRQQLAAAQAGGEPPAEEAPTAELAARPGQSTSPRRKGEGTQTEPARAAPALAAPSEGGPPIGAAPSRAADKDGETTSFGSRASREVRWLRLESEGHQRAAVGLIERMALATVESLRQQMRADAHAREIQFLRGELARLHEVSEGRSESASAAAVAETGP